MKQSWETPSKSTWRV
jgi:putative phosphoribosyl transferase